MVGGRRFVYSMAVGGRGTERLGLGRKLWVWETFCLGSELLSREMSWLQYSPLHGRGC